MRTEIEKDMRWMWAWVAALWVLFLLHSCAARTRLDRIEKHLGIDREVPAEARP